MWGPPVMRLFINLMNTVVIGTINHSYWSYRHPLSYRLGGPLCSDISPPLLCFYYHPGIKHGNRQFTDEFPILEPQFVDHFLFFCKHSEAHARSQRRNNTNHECENLDARNQGDRGARGQPRRESKSRLIKCLGVPEQISKLNLIKENQTRRGEEGLKLPQNPLSRPRWKSCKELACLKPVTCTPFSTVNR